MKIRKKTMLGILFVCLLFCLSGCGKKESTQVRVAALKGPTAMGMVRLMEQAKDNDVDGNQYAFTLAGAPDQITPGLLQGEYDIACVPANLAAVLYNKTQGQVQAVAINTLGVLYLVDRGEQMDSIQNLKGRVLYASGKGATPEYALNYLLAGYGLVPGEDVDIRWKSEHAECVAALENDPEGCAMLPQPFVTSAIMKDASLHAVLNLTEEWEKLGTDGSMITGVTVVRKEFAETHKKAVDNFLSSCGQSVEYVNENISEAAAWMEQFDIIPEKVAREAIPACNITCIQGETMENALSGYLEVLFAADPASVGGAVPESDFYYRK